MLYLDTSALLAIHLREARSADVKAVLQGRQDEFAVSPWTLVEVSSALALKVRTGALLRARSVSIADAVFAAVGTGYSSKSLDEADFVEARLMIERCPTALRAADALHLAICRRLHAELLTLDREMSVAAAHLGLTAHTT